MDSLTIYWMEKTAFGEFFTNLPQNIGRVFQEGGLSDLFAGNRRRESAGDFVDAARTVLPRGRIEGDAVEYFQNKADATGRMIDIAKQRGDNPDFSFLRAVTSAPTPQVQRMSESSPGRAQYHQKLNQNIADNIVKKKAVALQGIR
jgi:hypothetical protein